jgi:ribosomal protein S18 acetylase RimI-like enzyme
MILNQLAPADLDELYSFQTLCFSGVELPTPDVFRKACFNGTVFVYRLPSKKLASLAVVTTQDGYPYLCSIAVRPDLRNQGFGVNMLQEIRHWVAQRGYTKISLTTRFDNPAQRLYFKEGYRVKKVLPGFYLDEGDGIFMTLEL